MSNEQKQSPLTRQDYWAQFYKDEFAAFKDSGYEGEEWFEYDIQSVVKWLLTLPDVQPDIDRVLDIGCGNALFLVRLARKNLTASFASNTFVSCAGFL